MSNSNQSKPQAQPELPEQEGEPTLLAEGPEQTGAEREAAGSETGPAPEAVTPEVLARERDEARRQAEEHWDALLRTRAEFDNLRKRTEREVENAHKYGIERLVSELLPVKDSMELGLAAVSNEQVDLEKVREGSELTLKMLAGVLEKFGVEEVDPQGQPFNPEYHQAMSVQEAADLKSGTVVTVYQKGYVLNGRLVRPAMVIVAK